MSVHQAGLITALMYNPSKTPDTPPLLDKSHTHIPLFSMLHASIS
jgi:hypothetical protein